MPWITGTQEVKSDYRDRLLLLDHPIDPSKSVLQNPQPQPNKFSPPHQNENRLIGKIHSLQQRFGFITCADGSRWFFHKNFLKSDTNWENLEAGRGVTFSIGQNSEGECAIEVSQA